MTTFSRSQLERIESFIAASTPVGSVIDRNAGTIHVDFYDADDECQFLKSAAHALIKSLAYECREHCASHLYYYFIVKGE